MLARPMSRLAGTLSILLLLGAGPALAAGDPAQERTSERREKKSGLVPLVLTGIGIVGSALLINSLTGKDWVSPKKLDRDGPLFPSKQALGRFQVQGYAVPGWPVVLDIETEPGTETWLVVRYRGGKKDLPRIRIPGQGRRVEVVQLPIEPSRAIRIARFSVHSFRTAGKDKSVYQPHKIHAFGAGPRAVGSTTLDVTRLSPALARQAAEVQYSLVSRRLFDRSALEVLRLSGKGQGALKMVKQTRLFPLRPGILNGDWRQMQVQPKPASGLYHFQARAWLVGGHADERDWTGAIAPNFVRIP